MRHRGPAGSLRMRAQALEECLGDLVVDLTLGAVGEDVAHVAPRGDVRDERCGVHVCGEEVVRECVGECSLACHGHLAAALFVDQQGWFGLHAAQETEALVVLALGDLAQAGSGSLGPVEAVHAEVVLAVQAAYGLTCLPDHCRDPLRVVSRVVREFRHGREQACRAGELPLCADRAGEVLQHGGMAVPKTAQRVLGSLGEYRLRGCIEFHAAAMALGSAAPPLNHAGTGSAARTTCHSVSVMSEP